MSMGVIVVMIVVAMLVVVMVVVITVVIVITVVMMAMIMRGMIMSRLRIRAALGIERRLDLDDAPAQSRNHRLDDVIPADAQAFWHDLRRQMAVAEMPGDANQMQGIGAPDLDQGFCGRDHLDQPAVFQHQRVAAAQRDCVFQVEQEFQPTRPRHRHPPPVPVIEIEHDGIGGGVRPAVLAQDFCRADHVEAPEARSGIGASWFETRGVAALLTMRVLDLILRRREAPSRRMKPPNARRCEMRT
jgi:hypothetical protein